MALALASKPGDLTTFDGCGPNGDAADGSAHAVEDAAKNRWDEPKPADIAPAVAFVSLAQAKSASDLHGDAASIEGYAVEVKPGGVESCNCHTTVERDLDTHIYLGPAAGAEHRTCLIVEVTPRLRELKRRAGVDWSTRALKAFVGKHVRVTGWLFYDAEHENAAENLHPGAKANWRVGCAEIHPVTGLEVIQ